MIGYKRMTWEYLLNLGTTTPPQWYEFESSDVLTKLTYDEYPGTVLLGLRAGPMVEITRNQLLGIDANSKVPNFTSTIDPDKPVSPYARPFSNPETLESMGTFSDDAEFRDLLKSRSQLAKAGTIDEHGVGNSSISIVNPGVSSISMINESENDGFSSGFPSRVGSDGDLDIKLAGDGGASQSNLGVERMESHDQQASASMELDQDLIAMALRDFDEHEHEDEEKGRQTSKDTTYRQGSADSDENNISGHLRTSSWKKQMLTSRVGTLKLKVCDACNLPFEIENAYVVVSIVNDKTVKYKKETQKIAKSTTLLEPNWDEIFAFKNVSIYDDIVIQLYNATTTLLSSNQLYGQSKITLNNFIQRKCIKIGQKFRTTQELLLSQKYSNLQITVKCDFDYNKSQSKDAFFATIDPKTPKAKSILGLNILGRPGLLHLRMRVYLFQARNLPGIYDRDGLCDPYFTVQYCGVKARSKTVRDTLNPSWMEILELNIDVPQYSLRKQTTTNLLSNYSADKNSPDKFNFDERQDHGNDDDDDDHNNDLIAPKIRCNVYDWDPESSDDFIGRFSISFSDVLRMMKSREPRWYHLFDKDKNKLTSQIYLACEFMNPNNPLNIPKFTMADIKDEYYLHLLTIGVREVKSSFTVFKPNVNYHPSSNAAHIDCISTNPSSDPTSKNANYLQLQKLQLQISRDYELAPVINIIVKDNLFGGFGKTWAITRNIGHATLNLHDFMIKLKHRKDPSKHKQNDSGIIGDSILLREDPLVDNNTNEWRINTKVKKPQLIHENYMKNEAYAQRMAELRVSRVIKRVRTHSMVFNMEDSRYRSEKFGALYAKYRYERVETDPLKIIGEIENGIQDVQHSIKKMNILPHPKFAMLPDKLVRKFETCNSSFFCFNPQLKEKLDEYISKPIYFETEEETHERLEKLVEEQEKDEQIFQNSTFFDDQERNNPNATKIVGQNTDTIAVSNFSKDDFEEDMENPNSDIDILVVTDDAKKSPKGKDDKNKNKNKNKKKQSNQTLLAAHVSNSERDDSEEDELKDTSNYKSTELRIKVTNEDGKSDSGNENKDDYKEEFKDDTKDGFGSSDDDDYDSKADAPLLPKKDGKNKKDDHDKSPTLRRGKSVKDESVREKLSRLTMSEKAAAIQQKLDEWERVGLENCFDLDQIVNFKASDFEPEYLQGRTKYHDELEDVMGEKLEPFQSMNIYSGNSNIVDPSKSQKYNKKNKIYRLDNGFVGRIKGLWALTGEEQALQPFGNGVASLLETSIVSVRVYILSGIHLTSTDSDNKCDPYLKIKLGKKVYSTRDRYIKDELEPKFHEAFEFVTRLPGASQLRIQVWDWDGIGDDLVGQTEIDIEDRWFSSNWRRMKIKV